MSTYFVRLPGALIMRLDVPAKAFDNPGARTLLSAYLPGLQFLPRGNWKFDLHVVYDDRDCFEFHDGGNVVSLTDAWKGESSLMDLLFLTYGVARRAWLKLGIYPVHAAALQIGTGGLTLLVGHSGTGKTAVTLSSVALGARVYSGNKTLVTVNDKGLMQAIAGTRPITAKSEDMDRQKCGYSFKVAYGSRSAFMLKDEHYMSLAPQAVRRIVLPRLNDGVEKRGKLGGASSLHRLFPYFLDAVNADIVVAGGRAVLSGAPSAEVLASLAKSLALALPDVSVIELEGSMPFINRALGGSS